MPKTHPIPCSTCNQVKLDLHHLGFEVGGCDDYPGKPGFCTVSYSDPDTDEQPLASLMSSPVTVPPANLGNTQKRTALAIVNLFETSSVQGDYSKVTVLKGDTGHLTYGRSQTTLGSGNLAALIAHYCGIPGATMAKRLADYLPALNDRDTSLDRNDYFKNILRASADDPLMRDAQDSFFDATYWEPAVQRAAAAGIATPLGTAVVYDSTVHGSWERVAKLTDKSIGPLSQVGEKAWIARYIQTRLDWLLGHSNPLLAATRYRMDTFQALINQQRWALELPLVVRGQEISLATLAAAPAGCYDGPPAGSRPLAVQSPLQRGADVRLVQLALSGNGAQVVADGVYGPTTAKAVRSYQADQHLPATAVADIDLIVKLTDD
jgi:chitosanase